MKKPLILAEGTKDKDMAEVEVGYIVCRSGGHLVRGNSHRGGKSNVSVPVRCPSGKPTAIVHNHPSNSPSLSRQDKITARTHNLVVCVQTKHGVKVRTKCYRPPSDSREK